MIIIDLFISTKSFEFSVDGIPLSEIIIYMKDKLNINVQNGIYYLTRLEIENLFKYLSDLKSKTDETYFELICDNIYSMYLLMLKNEKAMFKFW